MDMELIRQLIVFIPLLLVLFGIGFAIFVDSYPGRKNRKLMLLIVFLNICLVLRDIAGFVLETRFINIPARTWNSIIGYSIRPVILLLFLYIVGMKRRAWPFWVLIGVNTLVHLTAVFTDKICFGFPGNVFHRGPLGFTSHIVSGILLACLLFRTIREYSRVKHSEMWIPVCNAVLVVVAVVLDSTIFSHLNGPVSLTTIAVVCATLFYYIWLHLQFVRAHERDLMAEQRIRIMMTQIQPHFLYNTLSAIQSLCRTDPEKAFDVTEKFGTYLRQNLDSLNQTELIPIQKELEHTRVYTEIEQIRFPRIQIEYHILDTSFSVPALTVQLLVENAIRHGVRSRQKGLVTIDTRLGGTYHEIIISDNGKGFLPEELEQADQSHIGLRNVRERIETMCGGQLLVNSQPGRGTTVTICIPFTQDGLEDRPGVRG